LKKVVDFFKERRISSSSALERREINNQGENMSDHIDVVKSKFFRLSRQRVKELVSEARAFIARHPGSADHSTFWVPRGMTTGLSARQVIEAARVIG
jgi:hypothetical protein